MAIALNKGESFELNSGEMKPITKIRMGVGWDPVPSGNFFFPGPVAINVIMRGCGGGLTH